MKMKRLLALALAAMLFTGAQAAGLKNGDRGGTVLRVQNELYAQGYLTEEGDGRYGKNTEAAVREFQQENGLEPTGMVDDATLNLLLYSEEALRREAAGRLIRLKYLTEAQDADFAAALKEFQQFNGLEPTGELDETTLAALESDEAVSRPKLMQQRLKRYGYLSGKADGIFGDASKAALEQFQSANGLEPTGEIDEASARLLMSDGAVGDRVRMTQQRLIDLGYLSGAADGQFGAKSVSALKKFQKMHGLDETGEADEKTWSALFSETAQRVYPNLNSASDGDAVVMLQQRLIQLGFLDGNADGDYGRRTYAAVMNLQKRLKAQGVDVEPDGEADPDTQQRLFADDFSGYLADVSAGYEGFEAQRIERRLSALGYLDAEPDEILDDYAAACIQAFQTEAGLEPTGTADEATVGAMFAADAPVSAQFVLHDVRLGDSGEVVRAAQGVLIQLGIFDEYDGFADGEYGEETEEAIGRLYDYLVKYNPAHAEAFAAKGMLTAHGQRVMLNTGLAAYAADVDEGAEPTEIERVQRRLRGLLFEVEVDGAYGETTRAAVEEFQRVNGLGVTGVADRETQEILFSAQARGNWTKYMLWVSLDDQRVYVNELDESGQYRQIHKFVCSTGLGDTTPRGIYIDTTEPLNRWHYFVEYECWAQYSWRIIGNYYFHSVLYDEQDVDTIRWGSVYALGYKASHGCVRLKAEDAKWIYEHCDSGTIVVID